MRNFNERSKPNSFALACAVILLTCGAALAQTTAFTYQGRLTDGGAPANGSYDLQFALFDNSSGGAQVGSTQTVSNVSVSGGVFTVQLDFGVNAFPGANRFLEISVRPSGVGTFATLSPRQQISSTPYAIRTLNASAADTLSSACVACVQDSQINSVAASKLTGSLNLSSNATFGGTLSGNTVNAATQFNIGGNRVLSVAGTNNVFAGPSAGQANTSGSGNAFVGAGAGQANTVGVNNSFFGLNAGAGNVGFISQLIGQVTTGKNNSFFGANAGKSIPQSTDNSFFGANAGGSSTQGDQNSFFGSSAGSASTGNANSFFGVSAGAGNNGSRNSFFGVDAGAVGNGGAASGDDNAFFGTFAGENNQASGNTFIGSGAGLANTTGNANVFVGNLAGNVNTQGIANTFVGSSAGKLNMIGGLNSFFGYSAGGSNTEGTGNSFFGEAAGFNNRDGSRNTFIGDIAGNPDLATQVSFSTAIGYNAQVGCSHCIVLGNANDSSLMVGIGKSSLLAAKLDVDSGGGLAGVSGTSKTNYGVLGLSQSGPGVRGDSQTNPGVWGTSSTNLGVLGSGYFGVYGVGNNVTNNTGFPFSYTGVVGQSAAGIGVVAVSDTGNLMAGVSGNGGNHPYVQKFHIDNNGTYFTGSDFAEALPARGGKNAYEPGDVLVLSGTAPGAVEKSSRPYDTRAAGVYSTRPGVLGADKQGETRVDPDDLPVAIIGVVPTKVSAENGPIQIGDLLTTSATPGYAMRCDDRLKCLGAVVGKAMETLAEGKRTIKVLVTLK